MLSLLLAAVGIYGVMAFSGAAHEGIQRAHGVGRATSARDQSSPERRTILAVVERRHWTGWRLSSWAVRCSRRCLGVEPIDLRAFGGVFLLLLVVA